ncbi:MAG: glucose-phosphate cytidylyltransferase [Candidatus Taylorbacteria bacterium]|nr:glucose-phosphate cytidylyltransferase [Candidatus Taylorbacteria bacterium]
MKVVILAGGLGTRLSEETHIKPKPMVEIGGKPILWHIMKIYSHYGYNEFIICLGYKGYHIKEWFNNYYLHNSDVTFDLEHNSVQYKKNRAEKWNVTLVDTGDNTLTGGRIKRIQEYVGDEAFMLTYGDGVANIDIPDLIKFHQSSKSVATITAVTPEGRFGLMSVADGSNFVQSFSEKTDNNNRVNGGFFVFEPEIFEYIQDGDATIFEKGPLENLAKDGKLKAYVHDGFWKPMDSLNDRNKLEAMWAEKKAPWKIWNETN